MIVEERIYTCYPGKVPEFMKIYETEAMPLQVPILGNMIGFFSTEVGPLNQVVHMWGYEGLDDRATRRAKLMALPEWPSVIAKLFPLLMEMENKILVPTAFSPIR